MAELSAKVARSLRTLRDNASAILGGGMIGDSESGILDVPTLSHLHRNMDIIRSSPLITELDAGEFTRHMSLCACLYMCERLLRRAGAAEKEGTAIELHNVHCNFARDFLEVPRIASEIRLLRAAGFAFERADKEVSGRHAVFTFQVRRAGAAAKDNYMFAATSQYEVLLRFILQVTQRWLAE